MNCWLVSGVSKNLAEHAKTKNILHVEELIGHRSINNALLYPQLANFPNDDFTAKVAHDETEACQLIDAGFEFVCDLGINKLFRRRK
jgi:hypothetical protein